MKYYPGKNSDDTEKVWSQKPCKKPKLTIHLVFNKNISVSLLKKQNIYGWSFRFQQIASIKFLWSFNIKEKSWLAAFGTQTSMPIIYISTISWPVLFKIQTWMSPFSFPMVIERGLVMQTQRFIYTVHKKVATFKFYSKMGVLKSFVDCRYALKSEKFEIQTTIFFFFPFFVKTFFRIALLLAKNNFKSI